MNHRASRRIPGVLVLIALQAGCVPAAITGALPGTTPEVPVASMAPAEPAAPPAPAPVAEPLAPPPAPPSAHPVATGIQGQAILPEGTLQMLKTGLRTQRAIDPADLSVSDLQHLVAALNGVPVPAGQITFQSPTMDDAGQIVITFTIAGRSMGPDDRLMVSLPSRRLVLMAVGGQTVLSAASTAAALLTDQLALLGNGGVALPQAAIDRIAARLVSAMLSSNAEDPTQTPANRRAVALLAQALANGTPVGDLAGVNLDPVTSGGGGGATVQVTGMTPANGAANTTITITGYNFGAGATVTVGGVAATGVVVNSETQITATVPLSLSGTGSQTVVVSVPGRPDGYGSFRVDPSLMATLTGFTRPDNVAVNPTTNRIYVASNDTSQAVTVIDGATNTVIGTPIAVGGSGHFGIAVNATTNRIYVVNSAANSVSVIDGAGSGNGGAGDVIGTPIPVGANPIGIAVNATTNRIYVATFGGNTVSVIDGAGAGNGGAGSVVGTPIATGGQPFYIAVNATTNRIYVTHNDVSTVRVIDGAGAGNGGAGSVVGTAIPVGNSPRGVAINPTTNRIYVASLAGGAVTVIDGAGAGNGGAGSVVGTPIPSGSGSRAIAVHPGTNRVYVTLQSSNILRMIDSAAADNGGSGALLPQIVPVGTLPTGIGINPTTGRLYVGNATGNSLSIIRLP